MAEEDASRHQTMPTLVIEASQVLPSGIAEQHARGAVQ